MSSPGLPIHPVRALLLFVLISVVGPVQAEEDWGYPEKELSIYLPRVVSKGLSQVFFTGMNHVHDHNWEECIASFTTIIEEDPSPEYTDRPGAHMARGGCHYNAGDYEAALADFDTASGYLEFPGQNLSLAVLRFSALHLAGDEAGEWAAIEEYVGVDADATDHCLRGWLHLAHGQRDQGRAELEAGLELDPQQQDCQALIVPVWRDDAFDAFLAGRDEEGLALGEAVIELNPNDVDLLWFLAARYQMADDVQAALDAYGRVIALYRQDEPADAVFALLDRAGLLSDQGRFTEALADFEAAAVFLDEISFPWADMARAAYSAGDFARAAEAYTRMVVRYPESEHWLVMRALAHEKAGQYEEALADVEKAQTFPCDMQHLIDERIQLRERFLAAIEEAEMFAVTSSGTPESDGDSGGGEAGPDAASDSTESSGPDTSVAGTSEAKPPPADEKFLGVSLEEIDEESERVLLVNRTNQKITLYGPLSGSTVFVGIPPGEHRVIRLPVSWVADIAPDSQPFGMTMKLTAIGGGGLVLAGGYARIYKGMEVCHKRDFDQTGRTTWVIYPGIEEGCSY